MSFRNHAVFVILILAACLTIACGGDPQPAGEPTPKPSSEIRLEPTLSLDDLKLTEKDGVTIEIEYEVPEAQVHGSSDYTLLYGDRQKSIMFQRVKINDQAGLVAYIEFENPAQAEQVLIAMPDVKAEEKHSTYKRQGNFIVVIETSTSKLTPEQSKQFAEAIGSLIDRKRQEAYAQKGVQM